MSLTTRLAKTFEGSDLIGMFAAIACISVVGLGIGLSFPLLTLIMESRDISATIIGANTAVTGVAIVLIVPFVTSIARQMGVANAITASILICVISLFGFYLTDNMPLWFILRLIFTCALTIVFTLSEFWINSAATQENRGLILGFYATILSLGFAIGPAILAFVGIHGILPFLIGCGIILMAIFPVIYARSNEPKMEKEDKTPPIWSYVWMVPLATMAGFVFGAVEQTELAQLPIFAILSGYDATMAAYLLTVTGLGNVLLQIPIGIWSDRVKDRRSILLFCTLVGLTGAILFPFIAHNLWLLCIVLFIFGGVVSGMYTVGLSHLGSRLTGTDLAQANAAFILCYGFGAMLGPQFTGFLIDLYGPKGFGIALVIFFGFYLGVYIYRRYWRRPT